jgi:hypothetical protein
MEESKKLFSPKHFDTLEQFAEDRKAARIIKKVLVANNGK